MLFDVIVVRRTIPKRCCIVTSRLKICRYHLWLHKENINHWYREKLWRLLPSKSISSKKDPVYFAEKSYQLCFTVSKFNGTFLIWGCCWASVFGSVHEIVALKSHVSNDKRWNVLRLEKLTPAECGFTIKFFFALLPIFLTTFEYMKGFSHKSKYFKETNFSLFSPTS